MKTALHSTLLLIWLVCVLSLEAGGELAASKLSDQGLKA